MTKERWVCVALALMTLLVTGAVILLKPILVAPVLVFCIGVSVVIMRFVYKGN